MNEKDTRGTDLKIENFRTQLTQIINSANLPAGVIYYIIKDILTEVNELHVNQINIQYQQFCEEAQEEFKKQNEEKESSDNS